MEIKALFEDGYKLLIDLLLRWWDQAVLVRLSSNTSLSTGKSDGNSWAHEHVQELVSWA